VKQTEATGDVRSFSYLLQKQAACAAEELDALAKLAAKRYVEERTPLNDTIQKLAEERDLNSHQVERVCEMANLATHQALWPTAREKEKIAFALADAKKLKASKDHKRSGSSVETDYAGPPKGIPAQGPSLAALLGVDPTAGHAGLCGPSDKQRLIIVLQKKAAEKKRLQDQLLVAGMEAETAEKRAYAAVKQQVLGGTSMRQVVQGAAAAGLGKIASELLPLFEERLIAESSGRVRTNLEKTAISRAPEDLISNNLGSTTIVNGAYPVLISLDTVQKKNGVVQNLLYNLLRIEDEVTLYHQKLHELG
jgi:hypothetical protein